MLTLVPASRPSVDSLGFSNVLFFDISNAANVKKVGRVANVSSAYDQIVTGSKSALWWNWSRRVLLKQSSENQNEPAKVLSSVGFDGNSFGLGVDPKGKAVLFDKARQEVYVER